MRRNYAAQDNATSKAFLQLATAADEFERYDHPHAARIARIADEIAKKFHMAAQDLTSLRAAALLHDLGEVAMEREYIQRAGRLTDDERMDLSRHPVIGEQECARVGADRAVQLLVRWHHEWWNGCGYPDALRQAEIPLAARVLRLADSYAALTDTRPYRPAMAEDEARKAIIAHAGIEFDPKVVLAFIELDPIDEMHAVAGSRASAEGPGEPASLFPNYIR
jgi:HD-GYP domain-containing protein (c-di-GMP phosphodiesterase class II)